MTTKATKAGEETMRPEAKLETITPKMAEEYLSHNKNIRKVTWPLVAKYADDMKNGRWKRSSGTIAFDENGDLKDGQHRLYACINSGCSFETWVIRGIEEGADGVIDIGKTRSAADQLKDCPYADKVATLAKLAYATKNGSEGASVSTFIYGKLGSSSVKGVNATVTIPAQLDDARENIDEYLACVQLGNRLQRTLHKFGTSLFAYFVWLVRWLGKGDRVTDFVEDICRTLPENQTTAVLKMAIFRKEDTRDKTWLISALLYGYWAYCDGRELSKIKSPVMSLNKWDEMVRNKKALIREALDGGAE